MRFKAAAIQFAPQPGQKEANTARALELVRAAAREGAKLVVLPELFASGYDPALAAKEPESVKNGATAFKLQEEAKRKDIWIVGSVAEKPEGTQTKPTISTFMVAPEGISDGARKIHLWEQEREHFAAGSRARVIDARVGRLGPVCCYDLEFPEVARTAAVKGANILVSPCAFFTMELFDMVTRSRALENGCWLVAANQIGPGVGGKRHCGRSRIVAPDGRVLADAGDKEGYAIADVDPIAVHEVRKARPYLQHLRKVE